MDSDPPEVQQLERGEAQQAAAERPHPGAPLSLRLTCCGRDLPTRVLDVDGTRVSVTAPVHLCKRAELGMEFTAVWEGKTGVARSGGTIESQRRLPPTWVLALEAPIERLDIEERYPDDSPGTLEVGDTRLPARFIDRSLHGVACLVPALIRLEQGQRVRVIVGKHEREGAIARVQSIRNQLRVGIRLDEL
ncbi:MAG TPA: PilZ domain-containing protein [Acidimicrobiia bacterium]|nr:PilZ domain-containing protein [Acidimicrobiia bacterium]